MDSRSNITEAQTQVLPEYSWAIRSYGVGAPRYLPLPPGARNSIAAKMHLTKMNRFKRVTVANLPVLDTGVRNCVRFRQRRGCAFIIYEKSARLGNSHNDDCFLRISNEVG